MFLLLLPVYLTFNTVISPILILLNLYAYSVYRKSFIAISLPCFPPYLDVIRASQIVGSFSLSDTVLQTNQENNFQFSRFIRTEPIGMMRTEEATVRSKYKEGM